MSEDPGAVREEAERLAASLLTRIAVVQALTGQPPAYDPQRAARIARAAGDVAVAVTGLLRELTRSTAGSGFRSGFATMASGLVKAAGVDLFAPPQPREPSPWQAAAEPAPDPRDVWRTVTRNDAAPAGPTRDGRHNPGDRHGKGADHTDDADQSDDHPTHDAERNSAR